MIQWHSIVARVIIGPFFPWPLLLWHHFGFLNTFNLFLLLCLWEILSSIKILRFFQIIKMDFQSCALYLSWNGPSVWVWTICVILFIHEISAMLFSLNPFLLCFSHHTRAYLWLHHFWSGWSLGMSQSFDGFIQLSNENLQYTTSSIASIQFQEFYLNAWLPRPIPNFLPPSKKEFGIALKIKCE